MSVALVKIQIRNDLAAQWAFVNPLLSDGEPGAESDTGRMKVGNGRDRWNDLTYVGGDGSGGANPIGSTIDGGLFTGQESAFQCGPPSNIAGSLVGDTVAVSWGVAYPNQPDRVKVIQYKVEYTLTPTNDGSWLPVGETEVGDPPASFAYVVKPEPQDSTAAYFYRVKAVLDNDADAEWGYSPEYRHIRV